MKTPKIHLLATTMPLTALLLSHCLPIGGTQYQEAARASPTSCRVQVSFRPPMVYPLGALFEEYQYGPSENEGFGIIPLDLTFKEHEDSDAIQIAPLVVTESRISDHFLQDWPDDVVEAELKSAWISVGTSEPSPHHPTEASVSEWMRSLR